MSFTRTESERLARLKGCTTGVFCRYGRQTGSGLTGPTGPAGYSFFTLGGNRGSLSPGEGSFIVVNMSGPTGTVAYSNILQASQTGYTGSVPTPSPYLKVDSDIIPAKNNMYNIGSANMQFKTAYFGANTVYIDGVPIGSTGGTTIIMPPSIKVGQTLLTASGDTLVLPTTVRLGSMSGPILGATGPSGAGPDGGMQWINTNLLGAAPQIVITDTKVRSTEIFVGWAYPQQVQLTFVDVWVPAINSFTASLDYKTQDSSSEQIQVILNKQTSQEYIDYKRTRTKIPITGIILTNVNKDIGYFENWVWHDGSSRAIYRYYHPDFESLDPDTHPVIKLWYSNFSMTTNEGSAVLNVFVSSGPPGQPRNLEAIANTSIKATLNFKHPLWVDIEDQKSAATIKSYTIFYDTSGSTRRYPGPLPQDTSSQVMNIADYNHEASLSQVIENLFPDSTYRFNVVAKNSANVDGSGAEIEVLLPGLAAPPKLSVPGNIPISIEPSQFYSGSIKRVSDGLDISVTTGLLLNLSADEQIRTVEFTSPIQHKDFRGSTATGLMRLSGSVKDSSGTIISTATQIYDGFTSPLVIPGDASTDGMTVRTTALSDANTSVEKQGFYLKVANRILMDISGYIVPAQEPYTMEIRHEHLDGQGGTVGGPGVVATLKMFYDEKPISSPDFLDISFIPNNLSYYYVSGIKTLNAQSTFKVVATISNMGGYFYKSPLFQYSNYPKNTINMSISNIDSITNKQANRLPNTINIDQQLTLDLSSNTTLFSKEVDVSLSVNNLLYNRTSDNLTLPFIIDRESVVFVGNYPKELQYININNRSSVGFHVSSGLSRGAGVPNQYVPEFTHIPSAPYDHTLSIESTEELQIVKGKFRSKVNTTDGYLDYNTYYGNGNIDYSTIDASGYRFATFRWELEQLVNKSYHGITFTLDGIEGIDIRNEYAYAGNSKVLLYYRFVEGNDTAPTNETRTTSIWADGNERLNSFVAANYYYPTDNTISRGGLGLAPINYNNSAKTVAFPVTIPSPFDNSTTVYCRIGLPMTENVAFRSISASVQIE